MSQAAAIGFFLTIAAMASVAGPDTASAQNSEVEKGRVMAERLCASCHLGQGQGEKQGPMGVPSFRAVANRKGQTEQDVVRWLKSTPPMMPNHHLTQDEVFALAAYIMTLRTSR